MSNFYIEFICSCFRCAFCYFVAYTVALIERISPPRRCQKRTIASTSPSTLVVPKKRIDQIEHDAKRKIKIETTECYDTLARCHSQEQSPLFNTLPRELRDLIWAFATEPFEDKEHQYERNAFYYRPGHTARLKTDYTLLLISRRVWLEANALPMLQAEHCFWSGNHRPAPDARNPEWMAQLTAQNRRDFGTLHLFPQMYTIEGLDDRKGRLRSYFLHTREATGDFQPRVLHVTIRHTDWWYWEDEHPLRFKVSWFQAMLDTPDLRSTVELKLELETLDYKVDQLMPIVDTLSDLESKEYATHIVDGKPTPTRFVLRRDRQHVHKWSGPTNIDADGRTPYQGRDMLNYHVVTLTWHLQFPEYPHAHVPNMRLAPRVGAPEPGAPPGSYAAFRRRVEQARDFPRQPRLIWRRQELRHLDQGNDDPQSRWLLSRMMHSFELTTTTNKHRADVDERLRRGLFEWRMSDLHVKKWEERWQVERSLLCFES